MIINLEDQSPGYWIHLWRNSRCDLSNIAKAERRQRLLICDIINYNDLFRSSRTPSPQSNPKGAGLPGCRREVGCSQWRGYRYSQTQIHSWSACCQWPEHQDQWSKWPQLFPNPQFTTLSAIWFQNKLCFDSAPFHPKYRGWEPASILPGAAPCSPCLFTRLSLRRDKHVLVFHSCSSRWAWIRTKISFFTLSLWSSWELSWEPLPSLCDPPQPQSRIGMESFSFFKTLAVLKQTGLPSSSAREMQPEITG